MVNEGVNEANAASAPEPPVHPEDDNSDEEDTRRYEVDGWHRGFDVEFHGVGMVQMEPSNGDFTESDFESDDSSVVNDTDDKNGYQPIPSTNIENGEEEEETHSENPSGETQSQSDTDLTPTHTAREPIQDELQGENEEEKKIEHNPRPILLDQDKVEVIQTAMKGISLSGPSWANQLTDKQLMDLLAKMTNKK